MNPASNEPTRVSVRLLEKEFVVACAHEERADLLDSAEYLNSKMREIRDSGKVVGLDRIAVMAALNLAHEVLKNRGRGGVSEEVGQRIKSLRERVETALARKGQQLEL